MLMGFIFILKSCKVLSRVFLCVASQVKLLCARKCWNIVILVLDGMTMSVARDITVGVVVSNLEAARKIPALLAACVSRLVAAQVCPFLLPDL